MAARSTVRYTFKDYLAIPEDPHHRHEIVGGELHVTPSPRVRHQEVVGNLVVALHSQAEAQGLGLVLPGPVGVRLRDDLVLEPDVVFVRQERLDLVDPEGQIHGPPDLVIEVLSPSNQAYDRDLKRKRYLEAGVPEVWIVDADAGVIEVWRAGTDHPDRPEGTLEWVVGERVCALEVAGIFASRRG